MRVKVCDLAEAPQEGFKSYKVDGITHDVLLFRVGDLLLATSGLCPHEDVDLDGGDFENGSIICPGHAYEFDVRTGKCHHDATLCLPTYKVEIADDAVFVKPFSATS